ncbi:MAG TPA: hypothetical protein VIT18_08080 [Terrimicrobiaceae bacterium]
MKVRILILASSLVLVACKEQQVAPPAPQIEAPSPSPSTRYLLRRVAVATEESLYGLDAGTELQLIEERPGRLLVQAQGMQFEIDPRDTTNDPSAAERVLRPKEGKGVRRGAIAAQWQTEDREFLAAENIRRSTAEQISHLRASIDSARAHIARLEAKPARAGRGQSIAALDDNSSGRPREVDARRQSISLLQSYIADCDREIQMLSDATPGEE